MSGLIRKKGKRSWQIAIALPRDPSTGKRRRRWLTVRGTKRDAQAALREALVARDHGTDIEPSSVTVAQYLSRWLADYAEFNVARSTYRRYRSLVAHVTDFLGERRLQELRPGDVQALYGHLLRSKGLSAQTVQHVHRVLHEALAHGVQWQILNRNVTEAVKPPRPARRQVTTVAPEDVSRLLDAFDDDDERRLVYVTLMTGLRLGEILAIRWSDVDFGRARIGIQRAAAYTPGEGVGFGPVKSASSRRSIALSPTTVAAVREHRLNQTERRLRAGPAWNDNDLVFCDAVGGVLKPHLVSKRFRRATRAAGFDLRFHDLRHSAATLMLRAGTPSKVVADRLGHSTTRLTDDVYSHVTPDLQSQAAEAMDALLR